MWVEAAKRQRKCHRCGGAIETGSIFVKFGEKERPQAVTCVCAECFEKMANQLFDNFQSMRNQLPAPPVPAPEEVEFRCFTCGKSPAQCTCGREAYA